MGVHARAHAAVEARRPPAVILLVLVERVLPVLPEPVLVQSRVQVVPRQDLQLVPLPGGVPVQIHTVLGQDLLGRVDPALVREVLAPAVEAPPGLPHPADHRTDPAVAAGEQPLDQRGLPVVVPEADGSAE